MEKRIKNEEKRSGVQDNLVRKAVFVGIADERTALICFSVEVMPGLAYLNMNVRLRGIVPKRVVEEHEGGTFEIIKTELDREDLFLRFCPRPEQHLNVPFLVDVYMDDGEHFNRWLLQNEYATEYKREGNEEEKG